jgi:pyrrolidone-carboxylate peptidase
VKSLLVGFNEFLDWRVNPARIVVETIQADRTLATDVGLIADVLPTEFDVAGRRMIELVTENRPDVVIVVGMAARQPGQCRESTARFTDRR